MANGNANINVLINGSAANATYGDLLKLAAKLNRELKELVPGTDAFVRKSNDLKQVRGRLNDIQAGVNATRKSMISLQTVMSVFGGLSLAGLFQQFIGLGRRVVDTQATFERFEAVLTNALGSRSAARQALEQLQQFAATTPFQIDELTDSFVKLVNRGFQPTKDQLTQIGDLAASQGKSFDQLVEAILDAQTGEFERLKEFGIRAKTVGDQVTLSFKGQSIEVAKTDEAIRNAVLGFGQLQGVAGSMEAVSKTLGGQLSNLADNFTGLLRTIGESGVGGAVTFLVGQLNSLVSWIGEFIKTSGKTTIAGQAMADVFTFIGSAISATKDYFVGLFEYINTEFGPSIEKALRTALNVYNAIATAINDINARANKFLGAGEPVKLPVFDLDEYRKRASEARRVQAEEQEKARKEAEENDKHLAEEAKKKAEATAREKARAEAKARSEEMAKARKKEQEALIESLLSQTEQEQRAHDAYMKMIADENTAAIEHLMAEIEADAAYQERKQEVAEAARQAGLTDAEIEIEATRAKYDALIAEAEFYGIEVTALEEARAMKLQEINQREILFAQRQMEDKIQIYSDLGVALGDFLSADEKARKKHADAIKAFEIGSILANLYAEIQGYYKGTSTYGAIGPVLASVLSATATVRAFAAVRRVSSQQFAGGGYTGPGGDRDSTGHRVAGVVHNDEWVAPKWMTEGGATAPVIRALEGIRRRGFADGGFTSPNTTPAASVAASALGDSQLGRLQSTLDDLSRAIGRMPQRVKAEVVFQDIETAGQTLEDIRERASL